MPKISELTSDTPAASDEIPIHDASGGDTNKITIADLAGNGLASGSPIDVGGGDGITVNASDIQVAAADIAGAGLTTSGTPANIDVDEANVDHDALTNFSADEHRPLLVDTKASRPAAGTADRFFWATDEQKLYRDTGSTWNVAAAEIDGSDVTSGTLPDARVAESSVTQHEPFNADQLQGETLPSSPSDGELLRYNGTQWEHVSHGALDDNDLSMAPSAGGIFSEIDFSAIDSDATLFRTGVQAADNNATLARKNTVVKRGWNVGPNLTREDTAEAALMLSFESYFEDNRDNIPQVEWHTQFYDENGTSVRPFTFAADVDMTQKGSISDIGPVETIVKGHGIKLLPLTDAQGNDNNNAVVITAINDEREITIVGGSGVRTNYTVLRAQNNNVPWLQQPDSGSTLRKVAYIASDDALKLGESALSEITAETDVNIVGGMKSDTAAVQQSARFGATGSPVSGVLGVRAANDENLEIGGRSTLSDGMTIQSANDAFSSFLGLEIEASDILLAAGQGGTGVGIMTGGTPASALEVAGTITATGLNINPSNAYSLSNVTTDRTGDANNITVNELADIVFTLIQDMGYDA